MNHQLFPRTGKCQNCHEKNCVLEEIEYQGKTKEWCEDCRFGLEIEK